MAKVFRPILKPGQGCVLHGPAVPPPQGQAVSPGGGESAFPAGPDPRLLALGTGHRALGPWPLAPGPLGTGRRPLAS